MSGNRFSLTGGGGGGSDGSSSSDGTDSEQSTTNNDALRVGEDPDVGDANPRAEADESTSPAPDPTPTPDPPSETNNTGSADLGQNPTQGDLNDRLNQGSSSGGSSSPEPSPEQTETQQPQPDPAPPSGDAATPDQPGGGSAVGVTDDFRSGDTTSPPPTEPPAPDLTETEQQQVDFLAEETQFSGDQIRNVREVGDDQIAPVLTEDTRRQRVADSSGALTEQDVVLTDDGISQQQTFLNSFQRRFEENITLSDIQQTEQGGFQLTAAEQAEIQANRFVEQTEFTDSEITGVRETEEGFVPTFSESVQREMKREAAANQFNQERSLELGSGRQQLVAGAEPNTSVPDPVTQSDFEFENGELQLTDSTIAQRVANKSSELDADEVVVSDGKVQERATTANILDEQLRQDVGVLDLQAQDSGGFTLTEQASTREQQLIEQREQEIGEEFESNTFVDDSGPGAVNTSGQSTVAPGADTSIGGEGTVIDDLANIEAGIADTPVGDAFGVVGDVGGGFVSGVGATTDAFGDAFSPVAEASRDAREGITENVINPAFDSINAGEFVDENVGGKTGDVASNAARFVQETGRGVSTGAVDFTVGLPGGTASAADTTGDAAGFVGSTVGSEGLVRGTGTTLDVGGQVAGAATQQAIDAVQEDPAGATGRFFGEALAGLGASVGAGRAAFRAGRAGRDRVRGAGSEQIDAEQLVNEDVLAGRERFPGSDNPDLVTDDPAQAVIQQSNRNTPENIQNVFDEAGVQGDADLVKALDVEPSGPGRGRAAQGIETPEADADLADEFETAGTSFGPELSPNFLRTNAESPDFSLRPGLPDLGNSPTAVVARTDVTNPDARTTADFDAELRDASGDTTARAIREDFASFDPVDEAEAQVPPGAEFADVNTGPVRDTLRQLGVGSDFTTEIDGRTVPVRTVAPESELDGGSRSPFDLFGDERAQLGGAGGGSRVGRSLERSGEFDAGTVRPAPISPFGGGGGTAGGNQTEPAPLSTPRGDNAIGDFRQPDGPATGRRTRDRPQTERPDGRSGGGSGGSNTGGESFTNPFGDTVSDGGGSRGDSNRNNPVGRSPFGPVSQPGGSGGSGESGGPGNSGGGSPPGRGGSPPGRGGSPPGRGGGSPPGDSSAPPVFQPPFGPPSSPPSSPPGRPPGIPPNNPPRRPRGFNLDEEDRDDEERFVQDPEGQRFQNPVATGEQFLFGGGLEEVDRQAAPDEATFGPFGGEF